MNDETVIKVQNVYKDFILPHERTGSVKGIFTSMFSKATRIKEKQHALKDISFEIKKGEFFGIVGRNGSGKSTLLKILATIYQPTKGHISTYGKLVPFIELGVGFNPELTGRDNVYLNGAILGFSKKEIDAMYDSIVDFAELGRFMDQKLKNYSSGMQVRLAFSVATRANADILLVDEVLAVGDADFQRKCYRHFKYLKKIKKTVIFVTHDMDAVREYCDRAMLIDAQEVVLIGKPDSVAQGYTRIMAPKSTQKDNVELSDRWGDGTCAISNVKIEKNTSKEINFSYVVTAKRKCEDPVYGFRIRNGEGQGLMGTNSLILGNKPKPLNKGEHLKVSWSIQNVFSEGSYYIDPSVVYEGTLTSADWWDGAIELKINRDRHTPYFMQPPVEVKLGN